MTITASLVKELRDKTGVGMMDCKKALTETAGDIEKAIVYLREHGLARAAKKAGRIAAEGIVLVEVNEEQNAGAMIELNCETDFVARNEEFVSLAKEIAAAALKNDTTDVAKIEVLPHGGGTFKDSLTALIAKIGENMNLRRVAILRADNGLITGYTHMGGKIGSLVSIEGGRDDSISELGKDLSMHVAASAPRYLKRDEVPATEVDQEKEIARAKLKDEKKPDEIIEKILVGSINKFFKEVCLIDQPFVKDPGTSVFKHAEKTAKDAKIAGFFRFQLGEGLEKRSENFAEEVAAQLKG